MELVIFKLPVLNLKIANMILIDGGNCVKKMEVLIHVSQDQIIEWNYWKFFAFIGQLLKFQ